MRQKTIITKLLQSVTEVYYKIRQVLQSASGITKCDRLLLQSVSGCYYKARQVLQSAAVITKWDITKCESMKLQSNFIEIALWYGCSPVNLLYTFKTFFFDIL